SVFLLVTLLLSVSSGAFGGCTGVLRDLLSFPTRRSSDLDAVARVDGADGVEHVLRRDVLEEEAARAGLDRPHHVLVEVEGGEDEDRKSTRLNSSHVSISYAVFCLKKKIRQSSV